MPPPGARPVRRRDPAQGRQADAPAHQPGEAQAFLDVAGWPLGRLAAPRLFLEVKAMVGCRITELASARASGLKAGRLHFEAISTKGRKERAVRLPDTIFEELKGTLRQDLRLRGVLGPAS